MAQRKGKYAHVTPNLPKLPLVEPARRDIVNAVKLEITMPPSEENLFTVSDQQDSQTLVNLIADSDKLIKKIIDLEKARTRGRKWASEYAKAYQELRSVKDKIGEWESNIQLLLDAYTELMVDQMDAEGTDGLRLASGGSISKYDEPYGQVKDKEAFRQWCIKNGYERQLQLWPSTMNTIVKERLIRGEPEPDGVEIFAKTTVRLNS